MTSKEHTVDTTPYVTVTHGMRGYFAVLLHWNTDHGGFWEPWNSDIGSYATAAEAEPEAKDWAMSEGVRYVSPDALIADAEGRSS